MKYRSIIKSVAKQPHNVHGETFSIKNNGSYFEVQNMKYSDYVEFMEQFANGAVTALLLENEQVCFITDARISAELTKTT